MKTYNIYEAKTQLSKLLRMVEDGEEVVIAKNGKPFVDLQLHKPAKNQVKFGTAASKVAYKDADFVGVDADVQVMFYGQDWDK